MTFDECICRVERGRKMNRKQRKYLQWRGRKWRNKINRNRFRRRRGRERGINGVKREEGLERRETKEKWRYEKVRKKSDEMR